MTKATKIFNRIQEKYNLTLDIESNVSDIIGGQRMTSIVSYDDQGTEYVFEHCNSQGVNCFDSLGNRYENA
jgi:hypothetical protein